MSFMVIEKGQHAKVVLPKYTFLMKDIYRTTFFIYRNLLGDCIAVIRTYMISEIEKYRQF